MSKMKVGILENESMVERDEKETIIPLDKIQDKLKENWDTYVENNSTSLNRALESAVSTFNHANNSLLIDQISLWKKGSLGKDYRIADALIEELKRRRWDKEAEDFIVYLEKSNYKEPWNN
jgi:hypothetical protein